MPFAGALFDFDGTLVDTTQLVVDSFRHTLNGYFGREVRPEEVYPCFGMPLREAMACLVPPDRVDEFVQVYRQYNSDNFEAKITLCPGVHAALRRLQAAGVKMGIVTSRMRNTTWRGIRLFNLAPYFGSVVTMEDVESHKPGPVPVQKALADLGLKPAQAIMLGDSPHDVEAARAAGVIGVACRWSYLYPASFDSITPDYVVDSMDEFAGLVLRE